jgi:hypothetical protein
MLQLKGKAPASLVTQWEDMLREDAKARFQSDPDRVSGKHPLLDRLL